MESITEMTDTAKRLIGSLIKTKNPWEQLFDFRTNTYFYHNRVTGEFSRVNPVLAQIEAKSTHVPPKNTDPLWKTWFDADTGAEFWEDVETGKICYARPEVGTFVSEHPLQEFRRMPKRNLSQMARKSIKSLASLRRSNPAEDEEQPDIMHDDVIFEDLSRGTAANQFDAAAMLGVGGHSN